MENKIKKKSINTMIYLLLAGMLACMIFVSIYTVASKRKGKVEDTGNDRVSTADTAQKVPQNDRVESEKNVTKPKDVTTDKATEPSESASIELPDNAVTEVVRANEQDGEPASAEVHYFVMPVDGFISKNFEIDVPVWSATMCDYRAHTGADIAASVGEEVIASSSGTVCRVWNDPMMGQSVTIDHGDDIYTTYMNLGEDVTVAVGDKVGMGQTIGCIGCTSLTELAEEPHLHLEMKLNGAYVDPLEYMSSGEYSSSEE